MSSTTSDIATIPSRKRYAPSRWSRFRRIFAF